MPSWEIQIRSDSCVWWVQEAKLRDLNDAGEYCGRLMGPSAFQVYTCQELESNIIKFAALFLSLLNTHSQILVFTFS